MSVFTDERAPLPREYIPVEQPRYAIAQQPVQHGSYYQGGSGSQVNLDGTRDVRYSVVPQQQQY